MVKSVCGMERYEAQRHCVQDQLTCHGGVRHVASCYPILMYAYSLTYTTQKEFLEYTTAGKEDTAPYIRSYAVQIEQLPKALQDVQDAETEGRGNRQQDSKCF